MSVSKRLIWVVDSLKSMSSLITRLLSSSHAWLRKGRVVIQTTMVIC